MSSFDDCAVTAGASLGWIIAMVAACLVNIVVVEVPTCGQQMDRYVDSMWTDMWTADGQTCGQHVDRYVDSRWTDMWTACGQTCGQHVDRWTA